MQILYSVTGERLGLQGPADAWRQTRAQIHAQVCEAGFHVERNSFVQHDDSTALDASLLPIPLLGFLPPDDVRVLSEEFDPRTGHMQGNFPQALSHMVLVNTARLLSLAPEQIHASSRQGDRPATAQPRP